jgi:pseudaminic acid synthase
MLNYSFSDSIVLGEFKVSREQAPLIIAELSANHNNSLERSLEIVRAAAKSGCHGIKLQTYTADTMTLDCDSEIFKISDPHSLWNGYNLHKLYQEAYLPWEWHTPIFEEANKCGLFCFSTPFDNTAVDFLESLNCPAYKIASFELTDLPLISKVAATGKPVILSTGMASIGEIDQAVSAIRKQGNSQIILLKCTSAYPAKVADANLRTIPHMSEMFNCLVGLSDHTLGSSAAVTSVALGAVLIEKHFTISRSDGGVDSAFSMEPAEMQQLVTDCSNAFLSLGSVKYSSSSAETANKLFRRSIIVTKDICKGEALTHDNVRIIRPGLGLEPKHLESVLGMTTRTNLVRGTPLKWEYIEVNENSNSIKSKLD